MPDVIVRAATEGDVDVIASLAGELGYPATPAEMAPRLAALLQSAFDAVLVAEHDGAVIGWIHVAAITLVESAPHAEIRGLVVTDAQRGRNVGSALVDAAERWAREQGFTRIRVRSNATRERTHRFYERRGYHVKKAQKVFDKTL
jgi:N-acetylglutamate synthase-like GNAT family acetyltransferase